MDNDSIFPLLDERITPHILQTDSLTVTAAEIFGGQTYLASGGETVLHDTLPLLSGNILYQTAVLVIFASYCIIIFRYRTLIGSMMKTLWSRLHRKKVVEERNRSFSRLLKLLVTIGMVAIAVVGVKLVEIFDSDIALPHWSLYWLTIPAAITLLYLIRTYRWSVLKLAGYLTYHTDFVKRIIFLTKIIFSIGAVLFIPSMIMFAVSTTPAYSFFVYLLGFEAIIWASYLLGQTYDLFVKENISILHWFLYLCGVEILPVSLLFVASARILIN